MTELPYQLEVEMDSFGEMVLGMLAVAERTTEILARPGEPTSAAPPNPTLLFALLGTVSLCRSLRRRVHEACPPMPAGAVRGDAPGRTGILR